MTEIHVSVWDDYIEYDSSYMYVDSRNVSMDMSFEVLSHIMRIVESYFPDYGKNLNLKLNDWGKDYYILDLNECSNDQISNIVDLVKHNRFLIGDSLIIMNYKEY